MQFDNALPPDSSIGIIKSLISNNIFRHFFSISDSIHCDVWDEITYPFANFNGCTFEVRQWISNFITHFMGMWLLIHAGIKVNPC